MKVSHFHCILRCHHCAGPLSKDMETSDWTIPPLIRDSFSMIGSAVGGTTSAFYGFNHVMPVVQRRIKGPMWLHFLHWCGAIPAVAQLISSSYHAAFSPPPLPPPSKDDEIQKSRTSSTI